MTSQSFHQSAQLNVIGYETLPLDLNNRARDQVLTLKLEPYKGHEDRLLTAVSQALSKHEGPVILMISNDQSDDYVAINIPCGIMATPANLFDTFMTLGIFPKPTHGWYPSLDV
jgi:hypothetical protein